jgi:hypothetical protein
MQLLIHQDGAPAEYLNGVLISARRAAAKLADAVTGTEGRPLHTARYLLQKHCLSFQRFGSQLSLWNNVKSAFIHSYQRSTTTR